MIPATKTGRALLALSLVSKRSTITKLHKSILAIEAEAAQAERERLQANRET